MLSDATDYFGLGREFDQAGYFATEHHQFLLKEMVAAIKKGRTIVLAGIVGCGKTEVMLQLQQALKRDDAVLVAPSLAVDKSRVTPNALRLCLDDRRDGQRATETALTPRASPGGGAPETPKTGGVVCL
jgi:type II secretory pathway predicted ATPase ExeA